MSTTKIPLVPRAAKFAQTCAGPGMGLGDAVWVGEGRTVGARVAGIRVRVAVDVGVAGGRVGETVAVAGNGVDVEVDNAVGIGRAVAVAGMGVAVGAAQAA